MQKRSEFYLILFLVAPFLFVIATAPYIPNRNEVWQLHAAARMAAGLGYTTYWNVPEDLSRIHSDFMIAWPAGYSIITAGLMKLGLSAYTAAKALKIFLIVAGVLVWWPLGRRFLSGSLTRTLFVVYICAAAVFISYSLTDLFCWAGMGILTFSMLAYADDRAVRHLIMAGIVIGAMILMRYHSLFLVPVAAAWCFWVSSNMTVKGRLVRAMAVVAIPLLVHLVIATTNISAEGHVSTITAKVVKPGFQWEWLRDLPGVALLGGLFLESLLARLSESALAGLRDLVLTILGWASFFGMLLIVRRMLAEHSNRRPDLAIWLSLASVGLVLFLGLLSISRYGDARWAPITEERYYWILGALIVLVVLVSIEDLMMARIQPKWTRLGIGAALAAGLLAITGYSINRYERYSNESLLRRNLISTVQEISRVERANNTVVFSDAFVRLLLLDGKFPVYKNADGQLPPGTRFSSSTTLIWVTDDPASFDWRSSNSMHSRPVGTKVYLFWQTFFPGSFSEQIMSAEAQSSSDSAQSSRSVQFSNRDRLGSIDSRTLRSPKPPAFSPALVTRVFRNA
jgi:hypothetical protein